MINEIYSLYKKYRLDRLKRVYVLETYKLSKCHKLLVKVGKEEIKLGYKLPKDVKLLDIKMFNIEDTTCIRYLYKDSENESQYILVREIELKKKKH